jgi:hypothetical protein
MSMNTRFFSNIRNGLLVLGAIAGLSVPAAAMPLAGFSRAATTPADAQDIVTVNHRRNRCYDGWCGKRYGRYNYWNNDWRYRHYRPYRRHIYPQFYFGLGVPTYNYYYAQPRRYYRGGGSAHVAWCYDRYRSYRAWDNTYQPYHGPRRQCWSPYS